MTMTYTGFLKVVPGTMMKVRILEPTVLDGHDVQRGDLIEAPTPDCLYLIGVRKAEKVVQGTPSWPPGRQKPARRRR
jgi:hypothetical protein